ncbi:MAG: hypothetical protein ACRDQ4_26875 [Pseudonocardiaceae bacterium]
MEVDDEQARLAAESPERRQADLEIRDDLAQAGFCGPGWDRYAGELACYGYAVMMAWLKTGEIFSQCKTKGCSLGSPPPEWTIDDRAELANETVALAINSFKQQALIAGKWTHNGGATLKTYFINACVFAFPNLYRKWLTDRASSQHLTSFEYDAVDRSRPPQDPGEIAVTQLYIREGFNNIPDDRTKSAVLLQEMGYTYTEIGEILQISSRAVDGLIRRQHERGAVKRGGGRHD